MKNHSTTVIGTATEEPIDWRKAHAAHDGEFALEECFVCSYDAALAKFRLGVMELAREKEANPWWGRKP